MPILARKELSVFPVLVFPVMVIASPVPDSLSINVQVALRIVLSYPVDVVYERVPEKTSSLTPAQRHATGSLATRVAKVALLLAPVVVWHVQILLEF